MTIEQKTIGNEEKKTERKEVYVDFDGQDNTPSTKILIPKDSYFGVIEKVELIDTKVYKKPDEKQKKFVVQVKLSGEGSEDAVLPLYANPVIKKSSGTKGYSNSKLYDLLVEAGELDNAKAQGETLETFEGLAIFLNSCLVARKCKALVGTTNEGTEDAYSTIKNIIRFEKKAVVK